MIPYKAGWEVAAQQVIQNYPGITIVLQLEDPSALAALLPNPHCDVVSYVSPKLGFKSRWCLVPVGIIFSCKLPEARQEVQYLAGNLQHMQPASIPQRVELNLRTKSSYLQQQD